MRVFVLPPPHAAGAFVRGQAAGASRCARYMSSTRNSSWGGAGPRVVCPRVALEESSVRRIIPGCAGSGGGG